MITGSFDTAVGRLTMAINDGGTSATMQITDIGSLSYDFDQTPESVTIDRVQALYSFINITILYQDDYGYDLWTRLIDSAISLTDIPCTLTIDTWDGQSYEFKFKLRIGDLSLSQINGTIQLKCSPNFDADVTVDTVFSAVDAGKKATFKKKSYSGNFSNNRTYTATGVKDWIEVALNEVFDNSYTNVVKPSLTNSGDGYTTEIYDTLQASGDKRQFLLLDISSVDFRSSEYAPTITQGTGTITIQNPSNNESTIQVTGTGTSFLSEIEVNDFIVVGSQTFGPITEVVSNTTLTFEDLWYDPVDGSGTPPDYGVTNSTFFIQRKQTAMGQPALKALKDLAGIEGSVFGSGFSTNFYFNRLRADSGEDIQIDFDTQVVDINPKPYYLSLGTSFVSQRADYRRIGDKLFGSYPSQSGENRQIPNLSDRGSITRGNANASKELKIELAPAYPMLNKGIRESSGEFDGDKILFDLGLESALTYNGLRSYFQAISSTTGNILIEITLLGAFNVKPWNTISFGSNAPDRYANKSFRPTSISYDLKNDTVKIKAYQIDTIFNQLLTDLGFNFVFGEQLIQEGLLQAVQAQSGEAINRIQQALFRTAAIVPLKLGSVISRIPLLTTGAGIGDDEPEVGLLSKDDNIIVFDPVTLKSERFVVSANQGVGEQFVNVVPKGITGQFPAGSYVYISQKNVTAGVKIAENSVQIFNETNLVGITRVAVDSTQATSLDVRLYEKIKAGTDIFIGSETSGNVQSINVVNSAGPGDVTITIQAENLKFPAGTRLYGSESQKQAILQVDPFRVLSAVTQTKAQNAIAQINGALPIGTYTQIPVQSVKEVNLAPSTLLIAQDRTGATQAFVTSNASQQLTGLTSNINVVSTITTSTLQPSAYVLEPSWRQSSKITQLSDAIELRVTNVQVQEIIDENLGGLLPAQNWTFENTDEGFSGNGVTLTNNDTYLEYLVTSNVDPYMGISGFSYDADTNPVVTIRLQLIDGTLPSAWNARFGWTTDNTNWYEQAFMVPQNIGNDFQFATIDLTSNSNYTSNITGVRLYLGSEVDDAYYIDTFTIGKYNPQTEILTDLTDRMTTAEGNITVNANQITSYVTGTQGLNKIADVTGTYGAGTTYDEVTLANIRSGTSLLDTQILIIQNSDGSFQQVTVDGDQDPLVSPLSINSIAFSEDIDGAILYEPSYAATSRITQTAGQLVLKASVTSGEISKLAFVRLDATAADGSEIFLRADKVIIDGQTTFLNSLRTNGIAGKVDVSSTIRSTTAPSTRTDGSALQAGDTWIKTNSGNLPYTYDGTTPYNANGWIRDYTQIDGGNLTTGTIRADLVAIQNQSGTTPNVKINSTGITLKQIDASTDTEVSRSIHWINPTDAGTIANQARIVSYAGGSDIAIDAAGTENNKDFRFSVRRNIAGNQDLSIGVVGNAGSFVTGSAVGDAVIEVSNGKLWIDDNLQVTGTIVGNSSLTANSLIVGTQTNKATISYTTNTARTYTIPNVLASDFVMGLGDQTIGGTKTIGNVSYSGSIVISEFGSFVMKYYDPVNDNYLDALFTHTPVTGGSDRTYNYPGISGTFIVSEGTQTINGDKIFNSAINVPSLIVGSQTNKATIAYTTDTARTYTIPNVAASNFIMSEGNQTVNGTKTFGSAINIPSLIVGSQSNKATIAYTTDTARTYTIPNVDASDFVMSEGTQTIDGSKTFTGGLGIKATAGGIASIVYSGGATANRTFTIPAVSSAATFAVLEHAQTFTGTNTFDGNVIVPDSTTASHALNVTTADSRYGRLGSANTWTSVQTFNSRIDLFSDARIYEGGANFYSTLEYSGSSDTTSTLPEATGTLVTTADFNQQIAGVKRFTGTLRASAYRSSDNTAGTTDDVSVLDSNANVVILNFKNGLFVGTT